MIKREGDVFTTKHTYIGHGVNVDGVMGAGVAKRVRDEWYNVYLAYKRVCAAGLQPGDKFAMFERNKVIVNMATQARPGADARYEWVFESALKTAQWVMAVHGRNPIWGTTVAIPQIGCGIGGLEWPGVEKVLETVEFLVPGFEFEVWEYK